MIVPSARRGTEVVKFKQTEVKTIRDQVIQIQQQADPIGFLIAVQTGALIEVVDIVAGPDGKPVQQISYVQANLKQRIDTARYLANKVLPSMSVQKVVVEDNRPDQERDALSSTGDPGQPSFAQIVSAAASKAQDAAVKMAPMKVVVEEPEAEYNGEPVYADSAGAMLDEMEDEDT